MKNREVCSKSLDSGIVQILVDVFVAHPPNFFLAAVVVCS